MFHLVTSLENPPSLDSTTKTRLWWVTNPFPILSSTEVVLSLQADGHELQFIEDSGYVIEGEGYTLTFNGATARLIWQLMETHWMTRA